MAHCKDDENFQRILECPICLERYTDPRCLPCLHSFCEKCIRQHMDENQEDGSFLCPMCNLKFQVPPDGVTEFRRNLYLTQISELFPEVSEIKCDVCKFQDVDSPATHMCIQCRDHLCQRCADAHALTKLTRNHKVVSLQEVKDGKHFEEILRFQRVHCPIHPEKLLEVYCENCMKPLCHLCAMFDHDGHKRRGIEEAARKADDVLRELLDTWKMASDHSVILCAERKKVLDKLGDEEERLTSEIQQSYQTFKEDIIKEIEVKMNEAVDELKGEIASARKQAEVAYSVAENRNLSITSTMEYCQEILDSAQDAEKLQKFQDSKTRLESLDIKKLESEVTFYEFELHSGALVVPNLKVPAVTKCEKERVKSSVPESTWQPDMKDEPILVRCLTVSIFGEVNTDCDGLAVQDDWLITTGFHSHKVKVFDKSSGCFLFEVDQGEHKLKNPVDVTCTKYGDIFVTDCGSQGVVRYNGKGQVLKVTPCLFSSRGGITCHEIEDQLIVTDFKSGGVLLTDFDCNIRKVISKESLGLSAFNPRCVCVDGKGHLVVSDEGQGRVLVIHPKLPSIVKTFTHQLGKHLRGVCVDKWGHILVADYSNNQVVLLSDVSEQVVVLIGRNAVNGPTGLAVTGPGEVAVSQRPSKRYATEVKVFRKWLTVRMKKTSSGYWSVPYVWNASCLPCLHSFCEKCIRQHKDEN